MPLKVVTYFTILHNKNNNNNDKKKKKHLLDYALRYQNNVSKTKMKQMTTPNLVLAPKELQLTGLH